MYSLLFISITLLDGLMNYIDLNLSAPLSIFFHAHLSIRFADQLAAKLPQLQTHIKLLDVKIYYSRFSDWR
jgi:hypothetical protein